MRKKYYPFGREILRCSSRQPNSRPSSEESSDEQEDEDADAFSRAGMLLVCGDAALEEKIRGAYLTYSRM